MVNFNWRCQFFLQFQTWVSQSHVEVCQTRWTKIQKKRQYLVTSFSNSLGSNKLKQSFGLWQSDPIREFAVLVIFHVLVRKLSKGRIISSANAALLNLIVAWLSFFSVLQCLLHPPAVCVPLSIHLFWANFFCNSVWKCSRCFLGILYYHSRFMYGSIKQVLKI